MIKKKICLLLCALCVLLSLSACKNSNNLPDGVQNVGGNISKGDDLLDTNQQTNVQGDNAGDATDITPQEHDDITADNVKLWFSDLISNDFSEYTEETQSEEDNYYIEKASLKSGGDILIASYDGTYFNTTFRFIKTMEESTLHEQIDACISTYLARSLTDNETFALDDAISSIKIGGEMIYLDAFEDYLRGYVYADSDFFYIQVL